MKLVSLIAIALCSTLAFAGHPAADRVVEVLQDVGGLLDKSDSTIKRGLCNIFDRNLDEQDIATQLLGRYARSGDTQGVRAFRQELISLMVSKAFPKFKDLNGGSYTVSNNVSGRSGGRYAVPVTVRTAKGKSYSGRAILDSHLRLRDFEYWGFSAISFAGNKIQKKIGEFARRSSTPVSAYVNDFRSDKDYIRCR